MVSNSIYPLKNGKNYEQIKANDRYGNTFTSHYWCVGNNRFVSYFDGNSALIVVGGAFGFMIAADDNKSKVKAFVDGAVYMGWIGSLIGWIAISRFVFNEPTLESIGAAFSVSLLTIFYGYLIKLVTFAFD